MAEQTKPEFGVTVSHRFPESLVASVGRRTWRDPARILSAICCRVLEMLRQEGGFQQDLSDALRRLRLDSA
ncbi:MAG: hypothetical protein LAO04_21800 [Acidobacteriia bacterium]|nr:hypothetical protein [Terriglobia bacterium]